MNNELRKHLDEKAQIIPIVVVAVLVMVMMAALILDGGVLMFNRRTAQAAADAGALAGARQVCMNKSEAVIETEALKYAVDLNKADAGSTAVYDSSTGLVTVTALRSQSSWFAGIFGKPTLDTGAKASAGCFSVGQAKVLPIAWACKKPVGQSDSPDCIVNMLDWSSEFEPLIKGNPNPVTIHDVGAVSTPMNFAKNYLAKYMYVVMDSPKTSEDTLYTCADPTLPLSGQPGKIDCDIDNDGVNDVLGHGDRSWLDLDGTIDDSAEADTSNGAKALKNWINGIGVPTLSTHMWLGGQTGVATSIFKEVNNIVGKVALVPVYDGWCPTNPDDTPSCYSQTHNNETPVYTGTDKPVKVSPGAGEYFHIIGFSAFYITCVDDGNGKNTCPGALQLIQDNQDEGIWDKNKKIKSIEGYFIENYPFDLGSPATGGVDVGVHIVSLTN